MYVIFFEIIAIIVTYLVFQGAFAHDAGSSLLTAFLISFIAVSWNFVWNTIFEYFERRQSLKGRTFGVRVIHAVGFEITLTLITVPLTALILKISMFEALISLLALLVFFFIFAYVYAWTFDRIFGLPASAI